MASTQPSRRRLLASPLLCRTPQLGSDTTCWIVSTPIPLAGMRKPSLRAGTHTNSMVTAKSTTDQDLISHYEKRRKKERNDQEDNTRYMWKTQKEKTTA